MRAAQKNGANEKQTKFAGRKDQRNLDARQALVAGQLSTVPGREFVWREIEKHGVFEVFDPSGSPESVYAFLGRRHPGIMLLNELREQHRDAFLTMWQEAMQRDAREDLELAAAHVATEDKLDE